MRRLAIVLTMALGACAYKADVPLSPSYSVVSSYSTKIPGKWLIYVEASKLDKETKTAGYACSFHKYPIKAADAFRTSVLQTLGNLVESNEVVPAPVDGRQMRAMGARGQIVIRGEEIRPHMDVKPGFWTASMDTTATMVASITVDGVNGRLFGQTVEGTGQAVADSGGACEGGAKALSEAVSGSMTDVMRKIGEAITNSDRVRSGV